MNREVDGSQETILFHVDDLKISHRNNSVLKNTIAQLTKRYGKINDLTVTYGKVHEFIGVTFDFSEDRKLMVKMDDYIEEILESANQLLLKKDGTRQGRQPVPICLISMNRLTVWIWKGRIISDQ